MKWLFVFFGFALGTAMGVAMLPWISGLVGFERLMWLWKTEAWLWDHHRLWVAAPSATILFACMIVADYRNNRKAQND